MVFVKHGSLFSGIGGFDLAAEWMGWENVFHCENNPFCQKILKYYWPDAKSYGDIKETDFTEWKGKVDIVSGGFPCQPYSQAGKRKGTSDDRHLWPEMLRAIREIQPGWVVGENVPGLLNWKGGMVLAEIKADLESSGFEVFPPCILPACGKNAPHKRDRLWIIANSKINSGYYENSNERSFTQKVSEKRFNECFPYAHPNHQGLQGSKINGGFDTGRAYRDEQSSRFFQSAWKDFPTVSPIRGRDDGLSSKLVKQCLEGLGNAVVPQIVYEIFKAINCV